MCGCTAISLLQQTWHTINPTQLLHVVHVHWLKEDNRKITTRFINTVYLKVKL